MAPDQRQIRASVADRATIHEASTKVHAIHPSGLPLTRDPGWDRGPSAFPLGLRTPPLPAAHAKGRARQRARARDYTTDITSALLTASPLAKCDIVSQRQIRMFVSSASHKPGISLSALPRYRERSVTSRRMRLSPLGTQ